MTTNAQIIAAMTAAARERANSAPPEAAAAIGRALLTGVALARHLDTAEAVQWEASRHPAPRDDTAERGAGGPPSDPTADAATDPYRLAVRTATLSGRIRLERLADAVRDEDDPAAIDARAEWAALATDRVSEAVAAWHGE